jgi:hypothetical protein
VDVDSDPPTECLAGRLQIALEVAINELEPIAAARSTPCSATCWLDRPSSAIARVGPDRIWPAPPGPIAAGWVVFAVVVSDLTGGLWWIAVGPPDAEGAVAIEVSER